MAKKMFKSESKRLLDMMINSIYTHKEIFLRELISNANDAIDKLYYLSLKDENIEFNRENFYIRIEADKEKKLLTITDTGIGMDEKELEENLGTIAKSGSLAFKKDNKLEEDVDIIGQFGVGFYSAFMIADGVTVVSKKYGSDQAYMWRSTGADGYEIQACDKPEHGTQIILSVKADTEDEKYSRYLESHTLRQLVKKYSDYIKHPIKMDVEKSRKKEGSENEYESYTEEEVLNSMVPLWKKNKSEISDEEYQSFYREKFFDFEPPAKIIHSSTDGLVSYTALLFIPKHAPFDYYTKEFKKGLSLYSNGVLIMDKCEDLLPDCFGFVRGLVDSSDLSLNISREMLQHDRQLKTIAANLKKKIKSELLSMLKNDRESYEGFYTAFARPIKFGIYDNYGMEKEFLQDLILFTTSKEKKLATLNEYVERMNEGQEYIYYATGESADKIDKMPQVEAVRERGFEILYLTEDVDEFIMKIMHAFKEKEFKSVSDADLNLAGEEEKNKADSANEENKDLFAAIKEALNGKVEEVKATARLKSHPVCISSIGDISIEMEKVLNQMPNDQNVKAQRMLEININHPIFEKLTTAFTSDKEKLNKYAEVLYTAAQLMEGIAPEDPVSFTNDIFELMH